MENILSRLSSSDVIAKPFPHLLVRNAVSEEVSLRLLAEWPSIETIAKGTALGSNERMDYAITDVRKDPSVTPFCREFLEAQSSEAFLRDSLRIFKPWIDKLYPELGRRFGTSFEGMRHGIQQVTTHKEADALLNAYYSINTPVVSKSTSVRTAHVDDPRKLFSGLLYMRPPEDTDSEGGELVLYRYRSDKKVFVRQQIADKYVEPVVNVPYERGTLVYFLDTIDALHGVTPRFPTKHARYFVNLITVLADPLFDIVSLQERGLPHFFRRVRNKLARMYEKTEFKNAD